MTDSKKKLKWRRRRSLSESERASRVATGREIEEYLLYLRSPWRVMAVNFFAGMMRGLGAAVGATAVIGLAVCSSCYRRILHRHARQHERGHRRSALRR